jgi:hypothetical protein
LGSDSSEGGDVTETVSPTAVECAGAGSTACAVAAGSTVRTIAGRRDTSVGPSAARLVAARTPAAIQIAAEMATAPAT